MTDRLNVVTGATGLLGSHVVEQLSAQGERVRALVRATSDTMHLRQLGVECSVGDLQDVASVRRAVAGAAVVYHCAARVGDWGPWSLFQREVIDATGNLLTACAAETVGRVLHVSSIGVYGRPRRHGGDITEDEPLGRRLGLWDYYRRAKIQAEQRVRAYSGAWTIVRPSWIYGPRDRNTLPRVLKALRAGRVSLIGSGDNFINIIYAGDVAAGVIRAANHPEACGQAYHLSSAGELTQRQFLNALTGLLELPTITRHIPFSLAYTLGLVSEVIGRAIRLRRPPHITRYAVSLIGRPTRFSTVRARTQLGWQPQVGAEEGLRQTLEWFRSRAEPLAA